MSNDLSRRYVLAGACVAQGDIDAERSTAHDARVEAVTGITRRNAPKCSADDPTGYWAVSKSLHDPDDDDDKSPWPHLHDRLFPLAENILSRKAQTLAGLAVQTRAIVEVASDLWLLEEEEPVTSVPFIEAVCAFVGVDVPVQGTVS